MKYDFILTAGASHHRHHSDNHRGNSHPQHSLFTDTLYAVDSMAHLLAVMTDRLKPGTGIGLIAAKTYYFGVGGGTQMFIDLVQKEGKCDVEVLIIH